MVEVEVAVDDDVDRLGTEPELREGREEARAPVEGIEVDVAAADVRSHPRVEEDAPGVRTR
jgi:hypothetical protein